MFEQPRYYRESWVPIAAGLAWLASASQFWILGLLVSVVVGSLLLSSGVSALLWPGDRRPQQFAAFAGVVGILFGVLSVFRVGFGPALLLTGLSVAAYLAAGAISVRQERHTEEVPDPIPSLGLSAKVALDDALLASMQVRVSMPGPGSRERISREVREAHELFDARGWLEKPVEYHATPPPLDDVRIRPARTRGIDFEKLSFESGYEPWADEPGRDRWLEYVRNRTAHAWIVRDGSEPRPWLVCIHGYQMGHPPIDLFAFRPEWLHRRLGFNLALPVLPLHGPRKVGRVSGDGFLSGDVLDTAHAEAQSMWDIRRLLTWIREQGATSISVYGLSLGGYNTALLAELEEDLGCAVAGIPATDHLRLTIHHGPPLQLRYAEHLGLSLQAAEEVLRVVSPLALAPRIPVERRFIFGAVADRLVPPDQVRDLWLHWQRPAMLWYQGSHLSFRLDPEVGRFIEEALRTGTAKA